MKSAYAAIRDAALRGDFDAAKRDIWAHTGEYDVCDAIVPEGGKEYFGECAEALAGLPMETIAEMAPKLMRWFQDLNWPGVEIIRVLLLRLPLDALKAVVCSGCEEAIRVNDEEWLYNIRDAFPSAAPNREP